MAISLGVAPVLSTPDDHLLEATQPLVTPRTPSQVSDEELCITYDIERTLKEIRKGRWRRIALQFPDELLPDAPRVFQLLSRGLETSESSLQPGHPKAVPVSKSCACGRTESDQRRDALDVDSIAESVAQNLIVEDSLLQQAPRLYILGDTSYGTCCVDEVAAEHVDADVVVHYGRACLSPTARLPVIHVFTRRHLDHGAVIAAFEESYPDKDEKVLIAADITYSDHVDRITSTLIGEKGYKSLFATKVVHDPSSPVPNRTTPYSVQKSPEALRDWQMFHISDPPTSLLLTLSSRVASIRIYPTNQSSETNTPPKPLLASTAAALRRRYAILTSLSTVPIFGILINTLSVKNYLHMVKHVQDQIAAAGKKSYLFVVGKLNAAKVANFSEIGGWVVIGCWESSLVDSTDFWKPVITPYELELALQADADRVWTGEWRSDYQSLLDDTAKSHNDEQPREADAESITNGHGDDRDEEETFSDSETAPPEFDLRTGRYVSVTSTRPMRSPHTVATGTRGTIDGGRDSQALAKRANGDVATIAGVVSPGAEFLKSNRTWNGLGSDFTMEYEDNIAGERGGAIVEGRSGIARGYVAGEDRERR